jgi:formiminotetrahydrofolate cyclodeaminase
MTYQEYSDYQQSLKPTQSKKKTQKDLLPAIKKKDDRNAFEKVADAVNSPLKWFDKNSISTSRKESRTISD